MGMTSRGRTGRPQKPEKPLGGRRATSSKALGGGEKLEHLEGFAAGRLAGKREGPGLARRGADAAAHARAFIDQRRALIEGERVKRAGLPAVSAAHAQALIHAGDIARRRQHWRSVAMGLQ